MEISTKIYWSEDSTLNDLRHEKAGQTFSCEELRDILASAKPPTEHPYNKTKIFVVGVGDNETKGFLCNLAISNSKQDDGTPTYLRGYDELVLNFDKYAAPLPIRFDEKDIAGLPYYL